MKFNDEFAFNFNFTEYFSSFMKIDKKMDCVFLTCYFICRFGLPIFSDFVGHGVMPPGNKGVNKVVMNMQKWGLFSEFQGCGHLTTTLSIFPISMIECILTH